MANLFAWDFGWRMGLADPDGHFKVERGDEAAKLDTDYWRSDEMKRVEPRTQVVRRVVRNVTEYRAHVGGDFHEWQTEISTLKL